MNSIESPGRNRTVHLTTLGCKLNQYESEAILTQFRAAGYAVSEHPERANVCVLNTCAVTSTAERKARSIVRSLHRRNPEATVIAAGCMAEQNAQVLSHVGADVVIGNREKEHILDFLPSSSRKIRAGAIHVGETAQATTIADGVRVEGLLGRTRAFLKVQDGCSQKCTYCVIPRLRGVSRSLGLDEVAAGVRRLADRGFKEVVITGVALGTYGFDFGWSDGLVRLLRILEGIAGLSRVRLGSVEPWAITADFLRTVAESRKICPHLHIPLQSAEDEVLHRMNRRYSVAQIEQTLEYAFRLRSDWGLGSDVIVGFPGETAGRFEATRRFFANSPFSYLHVFPFSLRPGTAASRLEQDVPGSEKERRVAAMRELDGKLRRSFRQSNLGSVQPILFERRTSGAWQTGHAPNYLDVYVRSDKMLAGTIALTHITDLHPEGVVGHIEERE